MLASPRFHHPERPPSKALSDGVELGELGVELMELSQDLIRLPRRVVPIPVHGAVGVHQAVPLAGNALPPRCWAEQEEQNEGQKDGRARESGSGHLKPPWMVERE
jgi:hypothetical protein